jgi:predicted transcriptional regulator
VWPKVFTRPLIWIAFPTLVTLPSFQDVVKRGNHVTDVESGRRDEQAMREIVERLGRLLAEWGLPRMAARVLFVLMTADEPSLTAVELAERLGVSPAAISGAVRYLTQIHMVTRDVVAGSRRDRYRLVDDSWYEVTIEKMTLITTLADIARAGVDAAGGPGTPAGARLAGMRDFYDFVQKELPVLLRRWQEQKG